MTLVDSVQAGTRRYVRYVLSLLVAINVVNYMDRMALSVLLPFIKKDLDLSDTQIGLLIGFAFSIFNAICGIPIARLADRGVRRDIIAVALAAWSAMTALSGATQNFFQMLLARIGVGIGEAGNLPPAHSLICDYVHPSRRAGVFAIYAVGIYLGMFAGMALAGWLGTLIGWRWTFVVLGLPGVLLALIVRLTLKEPVRGAFDAPRQPAGREQRLLGTLGLLWRAKNYRLIVVFLVVNAFVHYGMIQWWPSFYARVLGVGMSSVGAYLGTAIGVGSAAGLLAGGTIANRAGKAGLRRPLLVGAAAILLSMPAAIGSLLIDSPALSIGLVFVACVLWCVPNGAVVATIHGIVIPETRATAIALTGLLASLLGVGLGPLFVGLLSDMLSSSMGMQALRYALLMTAGLTPLVVILLYAIAKRLGGGSSPGYG